jgi:hypothetical protein
MGRRPSNVAGSGPGAGDGGDQQQQQQQEQQQIDVTFLSRLLYPEEEVDDEAVQIFKYILFFTFYDL